MLGDWSNEILFQVRKHLPPIRLKAYSETADRSVPQQDYFPGWISANLKETSLRTSLFYAWVLDQLLPPAAHAKKFGRAIDLGSKNFVYAPALCRFLGQRFESFELTGLEVDPYRTYVDLYKRGDYANYYTKVCSEAYSPSTVAYVPGNWLTWEPPESFDLVFCLFPFLFSDLNQGWGLTRRHFSPRRFYEKALFQSHEVIFFHQGEKERDQSIEMIESIGVGHIAKQFRAYENPWMPRKHPVEVIQWVGTKEF